MVSKIAFDVYAVNHDLGTIAECVRLDPAVYRGMHILDYLAGNTDRHPENRIFPVGNGTNSPLSLSRFWFLT